MSDNDLPGEGTVKDAPSFQQSVDAIADLIEDPDTDLQGTDEAHEADDEEEAEAEDAEADAEDEGDDPEEQSDDESEDDPDDIKGGRFAPDSAKVKLDDGRVVSIAELKRGTLFQADYTRKTTELAEERKRFSEQKALADDFARNIAREREILIAYAQQVMPQPPDKSMRDYDPLGYQTAVEDYRERVAAFQQLAQQHQAWQVRQQQETEKQAAERKKAEAEKLFQAMPQLKDREAYAKFWSRAIDYAGSRGFTPEELDQAIDHRIYPILWDAMEYRRLKSAAPKAKQDMQRKPVLQAQKRMDPKKRSSREKQARFERLKQTRSFEDGVASLMDLDI